MSILLPMDDNGHPINVLGFDYRGTQTIAAATTASRRNAQPVPHDIQVITLLATGPCRFELGDASVTADANTSPFLFPGQYVDVPLRRGERFVAVIAEGADCRVHVMGRI